MFKCCFNSRYTNKVAAKEVSVSIEKKSIMDYEEFDEKNYNPIRLDKGSSAISFKINIDSINLTCKKFTKRKRKDAYREVKILKSIEYERYLPRLYKAIETPNYCYILYQFIEGKDLHNVLTNKEKILTQDMIPSIIHEITMGLHSLFRYNYVHLDIKYENIIIESVNPIKLKIIDLAFCEKINNNNNKITVCGTYGYIPPEILLYNRYFHNSDIWSLGIIMFGLFTGKNLFPVNTNYKKILEDFSNIEEYMNDSFENQYKNIDDNVKDLFNKMLTKNPAYRISIKGVLKHDFIKNRNRDMELDK